MVRRPVGATLVPGVGTFPGGGTRSRARALGRSSGRGPGRGSGWASSGRGRGRSPGEVRALTQVPRQGTYQLRGGPSPTARRTLPGEGPLLKAARIGDGAACMEACFWIKA